jgi:Tfp pilus assembly protein PilZ
MDTQDAFVSQRRYPRRELSTMVALRQLDTYTFECTAQISEGGMLLEVSRPILLGEEVEITFYGPVGSFPTVTGKVVYRLKSGTTSRMVGIRFENPSESFCRKIRNYVEVGEVRPLAK